MGTMKKRTVWILSLITGLLGLLFLFWLVFDYAMYNRLKPLVLRLEELGRLEKLSEFIWLSFLGMFFFHLLAAGTLVIQMRFIRKIRPLSILAVLAGILSFLGLFSDWAVLGDIGKEYKMGWDTSGEWIILYILLGIHAVFILLVTGISAGILRYLRQLDTETEMAGKDEIVFVIAQCVGIICGMIGLGWIALGMAVSKNVNVTVYHSLATGIIILVPYGLIVSYWLILKLRERVGEWYDEKQWHDVTRAGFTTLLLLIPALLFYFIAFSIRGDQFPAQYMWFPFALFVILFFFSLFTLLNYRRN